MAEVVFTAGKAQPAPLFDAKREAIKSVRQIIRNPASTDDQVDDALEALVELSKD